MVGKTLVPGTPSNFKSLRERAATGDPLPYEDETRSVEGLRCEKRPPASTDSYLEAAVTEPRRIVAATQAKPRNAKMAPAL